MATTDSSSRRSDGMRTGLAALVIAVVSVLSFGSHGAQAAPTELIGTFRVTAGACDGSAVTGSYFRMILPSGDADGPFIDNGDSTCPDKSYTALVPGTAGGLRTGEYQANPDPAFDAGGNGLAASIIAPTLFFGVDFAASTNAVDPQTGVSVPAPTISNDDGALTGDVRAFAAAWNGQQFNQGAPKPSGDLPGNSAAPTGTYDPATGAYVIEWASQIEGGPFDNFTGVWHFEGIFVPEGAAAPPTTTTTTTAPAAGGGGAAVSSTTTTAVVTSDETADDAPAVDDADDTAAGPVPTVGPADPGDESASAELVREVAGEDGWEPPALAVIFLALLAAGGGYSYLRFDRAVRAIDVAAPSSDDSGGGPGSASMIAVIVIGVGLALAPVAFQMFDRAPKGGDMIDGFGPYMDQVEIDEFRDHLAVIGAAGAEATASPSARALPAVVDFNEAWAGIDKNMGEMLDSMEANLDNYAGVAALPPFPLFPWFFVAPGVMLAGAAVVALRSPDRAPVIRKVLIGLGVGLLAAPAVFQMFTRAPGGAEMIADFKPIMTEERVQDVQGYFLVIGGAEGSLRREVLPAAGAGELPAVRSFVEGWPAMSGDMAPMIGAMADNVENFAAVVALPPFGLFPWFFVAPGLLVIGLAVADGRRTAEPATSLREAIA